MTEKELKRFELAFSTEPTFRFLSPEGQVGYPRDLLTEGQQDLQRLIAMRHDYEFEASKLVGSDVSPVPGDPSDP